MNTKLVLYRPPGKVVACLIMLSLNEATDSSGKKVPSITPVDSIRTTRVRP